MSEFTGREEHPVLPLLDERTRIFKGEEWAARYDKVRAEAMARMEADPLQFGYEPPIWKKADERLADFRRRNPEGVLIYMVLGGNRASKTEWRSKRLVENMRDKPDYKAWACHATQEASRDAQQKKIYRYLPPEYKADSGRLRVGKSAKVVYTPWGGFTEDVFAFPSNVRGLSECRFKFYGMNPRSLEGAEIDEGWMDEESSLEWLDALIWRAVTRNGIIFLTFTSKDGYTSLVRSILQGAVTIEEEDAELLAVRDANGNVTGCEKVPRVQENLNMVIQSGRESESRTRAKASIIYFHASDNPFGNPEAMKATLEGANRTKILSTYYGVPTRAMVNQFNYNDLAHTVKWETYQALLKQLGSKGSRYQLIDPCPGRNWFMLWIWFWAPKRAIIYREWPSFGHKGAFIEAIGDPGPWAVPGNSPDGQKGEAQTPFRFGYARYTEEIAKAEGWWNGDLGKSLENQGDARERITERLVDGRYAVAPSQVREGATTWIQQMAELGLGFVAMKSEKQILSGETDGSVEMINAALAYDEKVPIGEFSADLARINEPNLQVLETCPNTRYALETWTGRDGAHGACKDPIDCVRGVYLSELDYLDDTMLQPITPWRNQFSHKGI